MKKIFAFIAVTGLLTFGSYSINAQENMPDSIAVVVTDADGTPLLSADGGDSTVMQVNQEKIEALAAAAQKAEEDKAAALEAQNAQKKEDEKSVSIIQSLKKLFIDGGPIFMSFVLLALVIGLALCIERIIYLTLATSNNDKLLKDVESALQSGGVEAAKDVCRNARGPVASIFYQGLDRSEEGIEQVEKAVVSYGGVQMGLLEKGLPWIGLMIALAPMLGFMGTVIGMIQTFELIATTGEAKPQELAGGIQVALITTVSGLVVAIILQIFYNYIVSKIDSIVNDMENASISLVDLLVKNK